MKIEDSLKELESILELYANTYIGTPRTDGTYQATLTSPNMFGECTLTYDPRPAKKGLEIIESLKKENIQ